MIRSFQWDLARQVERLDWLIAQLPRYADWGYQEVHLHLEDAVDYPSLPGVARHDAYSYPDFERLVAEATRCGIKVVPIVNLLGHTQYLIKVPELRDLNELRSIDGSPLDRGQICPLHPRTLEIAARLLQDVAPFCTAGKVHVGLDESFHLGRHPLSRQEIAEVGLAAHFARYVGRLRGLTSSLGLQMSLWADMLYFLPEAIPLLPTDITAYEWYYYPFKRRPRIELFNFAESTLAAQLRAQGIPFYGCPMNGAFRFEPLPLFSDRLANITSWWRYAHRQGACGFLVSSWEPYRLAAELTTVVDAAAATLWLRPEVTDAAEMLALGFARASRRVTMTAPGRPASPRTAARLALQADTMPFAGYARWEANERWDLLSRREPLARYRTEATRLAQLAAQATAARLPVPLRASLDFRAALALRDLLVRELARDPNPRGARPRRLARLLRQALKLGRQAARTMWARTRDESAIGPNERMVAANEDMLRAWQAGEPVFGPRWQLCYDVWNFAPCVQLVGVERQLADGTWQTLQACHTIEFQAKSARPRGGLIRAHAAPVEWDGDLRAPPRLRLFVRGIGEVRIGRPELVDRDGTSRVPATCSARWIPLGRPAPKSGWPVFADETSAATLELTWPAEPTPPVVLKCEEPAEPPAATGAI